MTVDEVVQAVRKEFDSYRQGVVDFPAVDLIEQGVRQDDQWYYIPVIRHDVKLRAYMYYDHLNAIESLLKEDYGVDVLFVPAGVA
jgi:hypothetical protein